jgi:RimJ/RimL family protein N-acetyltransferase
VIVVQTGRLTLRRWREDDVATMARYNADPQVMRWIGRGTVRDQDQTRASIEAIERLWDEKGFGIFAIEVRATGELAGLAGLAIPHFLPEIMPSVEIAWRLGRAFWGQGIATEAARAALADALLRCGLDRIVAVVQIGNSASEAVTRKLGMWLERETIDPGSGRQVRVYEISSEAYDGGGQA